LAASLAGVSVLVLGLSLSAGVWLLLQSIWPASVVGWAFALPMVAATLLFGLLLLVGGRRLRKSGTAHQQAVQLAAVQSIVQHRRGPVSAHDIAGALQLPEPEVDALLTQLARQKATAVTLDVDDRGHIVYDFEGEERRWRVLDEPADEQADAENTAPRAERRR